jgi:hypothetical protein
LRRGCTVQAPNRRKSSVPIRYLITWIEFVFDAALITSNAKYKMLETSHKRRLFILANDWTWWTWMLTAALLAIGLFGFASAFVAAILITAVQSVVMFVREKSLSAFAVQLRLAYLLLLLISVIRQLRWLYWVPMLGTFALVVFGYCLLARILSLLPCNRQETLSTDLLWRTFISRPDLSRLAANPQLSGCPGGICTIEAQVERKRL